MKIIVRYEAPCSVCKNLIKVGKKASWVGHVRKGTGICHIHCLGKLHNPSPTKELRG